MPNSKSDLAIEVVALRKQVADLKDAAAARRRVEDALRASDELARATLEDCPVPLCRLDGSGRVLYANTAFAEWLGYASRREFLELVSVMGLFVVETPWSSLPDRTSPWSDPTELPGAFRSKEGPPLQAWVRVSRGETPLVYTMVVLDRSMKEPGATPSVPLAGGKHTPHTATADSADRHQ